MLKVVSFGAGVQSTTILALIAAGRLERPDALIFADTQWEPRAVYEHLEWCEKKSAEIGIPLYRVTAGSVRDAAMRGSAETQRTTGERWVSVPLFTDGGADGGPGIIRRQCTKEYKIEPIERKVRELLNAVGKRLREEVAEQWIGISLDEVRRMKPSPVRWKRHRFPLIELGMRRSDCLNLLRSMGWPEAPRSACLGCPFHSDREWLSIRKRPEEWADAIEFDRAIRDQVGLNSKAYVHRQLVPLDQVDFSRLENQPDLFTNECEGMCGV